MRRIIESLQVEQLNNSKVLHNNVQHNSVNAKATIALSWQYKAISSGKLRRYFSLKNVTDTARIMAGFFQSFAQLKSFKPDVVFCKGGYVTVPVAAAAYILNIPVWIHESDVSLGLATRINSKFAKRIFVSFEETKKYFTGSRAAKVQVVGNPIRASVTHGNAQRAREFLLNAQMIKGGETDKKGLFFHGFSEKIPVILVMGGSLGSQFVNEALDKSLDVLLKEYAVIHITGNEGEQLIRHERYRSFHFINEELPDCYALADVIVSRSGAGSVFECAAVKKPTVFIPLSSRASRGDQIENAKAAARFMNAHVIEEEQLLKNPSILPQAIHKIMSEQIEQNPEKNNREKNMRIGQLGQKNGASSMGVSREHEHSVTNSNSILNINAAEVIASQLSYFPSNL